jgi:hypothetical protein
MGLELDMVSQIMYFQEGEINPGDEKRVDHYERKIADWQHDVVARKRRWVMQPDSKMPPTKQEILEEAFSK